MSLFLRALALVCLLLGVVCALHAPADAQYAVEAAVWFSLELFLLWLSSRRFGAKHASQQSTKGDKPAWLRQQFAETVPAAPPTPEKRQRALSTVD